MLHFYDSFVQINLAYTVQHVLEWIYRVVYNRQTGNEIAGKTTQNETKTDFVTLANYISNVLYILTFPVMRPR